MTAAPWLTDEAVRAARQKAYDGADCDLVPMEEVAASLDALAEAAYRAGVETAARIVEEYAEGHDTPTVIAAELRVLLPQPERSETP